MYNMAYEKEGEQPQDVSTKESAKCLISPETQQEISATLRKLGMKNIAPSHCTGRTAMQIFEQEWGEQFLRLYLGDVYRL